MNIEQEISEIKTRNQRVETDKAWEVSKTRRVSIALFTYVVALVWMVIIKETIPYLKALVPTLGYLLSTLSLPFIKDWWAQRRK